MPNAPRIVVSNKLVYTERLVADLNFWSEVERYDVYEKCFRYDIFSISILAIDTSNNTFINAIQNLLKPLVVVEFRN